MKTKTLLTATCFLLIVFISTMSACKPKCKDCVTTPPPLNAYATQLIARDHDIDSATAADWIQRYIANKDSICNNMVGTYDSVLNFAEDFNKQSILDLLCLKGCIGIRIYQGMDTNFRVHNILTGVNQSGDKIYDSGYAKENGMPPPCPTCP